jgi:hypothetical protein
VRQLNFYGFRKIRSSTGVIMNDDSDDDGDDRSRSGNSASKMAMVCRFYHEFFQANRPELLNKIQRATRSAEPPHPIQFDQLRYEVEALKKYMEQMTEEFDVRLGKMKRSIELTYECRISALERAYQDLAAAMIMKNRFGVSLTTSNRSLLPFNSMGVIATFSASSSRSDMVASMVAPQDKLLADIDHQLALIRRQSSSTANSMDSNIGRCQHLPMNSNPLSSDLSAIGMPGKMGHIDHAQINGSPKSN